MPKDHISNSERSLCRISTEPKHRWMNITLVSMEEDMTFGRIDQTTHVYTQSNQREQSFSCPIEMIVLKK